MSTASNLVLPRIDILLPSSLLLHDAVKMLTAKFGQWSWYKYDGIPVLDPWVISCADVDIAFEGIKARTPVPRNIVKQRLRDRQSELFGLLRSIPLDAALEDVNLADLREPTVGLFDCLTSLKGIKLANASKITHRHRPRLLPVLDLVVRRYYWYATFNHDKDRFRELERKYRESRGEYAFALMELIREDLRGVRLQIDEVRQAVRDTEFAGATPVRILEALIWYYYASSLG